VPEHQATGKPGGTKTPPTMTAGEFFRRLGPASILAFLALAGPIAGGFLILGFMDTIAQWLHGHEREGLAIYAGAFALLSGLALIPTYAPSILGGWTFGILVGFPAALTGFIGGAVIGYFIARRASGDRVVRLIEERPSWAAVRDALLPGGGVGAGFWKSLGIVTLLRLPPNSPFAATNLVLASVKTRWPVYLLGTALGLSPRTFAAIWLGATLHHQFASIREGLDAPKPWWLLVTGIVLVIVVLGVIGVIAKRALERVTNSVKRNSR